MSSNNLKGVLNTQDNLWKILGQNDRYLGPPPFVTIVVVRSQVVAFASVSSLMLILCMLSCSVLYMYVKGFVIYPIGQNSHKGGIIFLCLWRFFQLLYLLC